ncbi:lysylphosphatidylglycerol synthase transmembrane domain-containing protein [Catenovulum agarivorans]|uniref:lysylphosphatidylglycerol synthase transmembrane domain-containing protein n=1 Tax=Catenovulum agarivorans TaxID=1172192 RepID=UPI0002DB9E84|nr:lysylphosphatidylglycerol synthase transmembrane domain-containing protein [Catenovulum agarivorans]
MDWNKTLRWIIATSIFIAVIYGIELYIGWKSVFAQWQNVSPSQLVLLTLVTFASYWLRAWRVYCYFGQKTQHPFSPYIRINLLHNALNNFLPMRLGEASFPLFMKQSFAFPLLKSTAGLLVIRLMDLHWLLVLLVVIASQQISQHALWLLIPLILVPLMLPNCWDYLHKVAPEKIKQKLIQITEHAELTPKFLARIYLLTVLIWLVKLSALCLILQFFIPLPSAQALFAVISADLSSILPIHGIAGSGTFEAAILAALLPLGINQQQVLSAAINLHIYVLVVTLLSVPVALCFKQK